jgi:Coenzyme PQQ synthesis protein D (PqqD)
MADVELKLCERAGLPSPRVRRFEIDGGLLLLDASSNALFAYNDVARGIWESIEAGRSEAEIIDDISGQWSIPAARAQGDVRAIVTLWQTQGLIGGDGDSPTTPPSAASAPIAALSAPRSEWTCTIRGTPISFAIVDELLHTTRAMFGHLETPSVVPQCRMTIARTQSGEFALLEDGRERLRTDDPALAIGALFVAVLECIRPGVQWFALLHGAALARNGHGFALAGAPGAGKSTLAAGLIAAGFDYLADDLVALSSPDAAIVPWPLPLSLKSGSLDTLAPRLPQLATAPPYRTKGMDARLLVPDARVWEEEPVALRTLFFPRFIAGAAPEARRLSPFDALQRLLADRVWLGDPITEERVASFLAWLNDIPAYALSYGTLDDAVGLVESIVH